ncbi:aspartate aminotransferase [Merismopedia glauca CCAP 1448/3]|uniref:Aspartate aminotransferase n=2 Tax=Merismopedia TaxID=53402 RepID=A0A2T1C128_9CYAN|nr:aspartate aminotransferase [Merismopedia glauca CCAP 1448/3]
MQAVQSPIIPIVAGLIRQNPGTISLGQGVVSYPPPDTAFEQISQFFAQPENHKYQAVTGIPLLKEAIAHKLVSFNHITLDSDRAIVVTAGSNMAFNNVVLGITNPGDEIILPTPYYFNHEMAIAMASCKAVLVPTDANYQLDLDAISGAITPKTRAIVTISPNNPTGAVYPQSSLEQVNQICRDNQIYHISDEAYEYFTYDGVKHFSPGSIPDSSRHTISLYSLSKAYGFASWRIGYMVIPQHLVDPINKIQDTILICPPVISQYAALGALQTGISYCQEKLTEIAIARQIVLAQLKSLGDICTIPQADGAFYFLLKVNTSIPDLELVEKLIKDYRVAVLPGNTFGVRNGCYLRVAYGALSPTTAREGIERLVKGLTILLSVAPNC